MTLKKDLKMYAENEDKNCANEESYTDDENEISNYSNSSRNYSPTLCSTRQRLRDNKTCEIGYNEITVIKKTTTKTKTKVTEKAKRDESTSSWNLPIIVGVLLISILILIGFILLSFSNRNSDKGYLFTKCSLDKVFDRGSDPCQVQGDLCRVVQRGIENSVRDPSRPNLFVLLVNKKDRKVADCWARLIAGRGSCGLNSTGSLILTPTGLAMDTAAVIREYQDEVAKYKSVIFSDLLSANAQALKALHNFCDTVNPLVTPAIYTMVVITDDDIDYSNQKSITKTVDRLLKQKFQGKVEETKIQPLVTRITDGPIVAIKPGQVPEKCQQIDDKFIIKT